ncbi:hypothetical protein [uncultured Polaribacter sp.]|uniref:hypothetical protein n=1 Tax=uncultured Polaribacter sp. TaxID=174711 RepID=UPI0026274376|nr:hypothetical protein [uncultured Polaribacter sp.]
MKYFKLLIIMIYVPLFGQENNSLQNSSYILDNEQAKFILLDGNDNIIFKGDFKNDNFKSKHYLFSNGIIYQNKDSIGFYSNKNIFFSKMKFRYKNPLFKNNTIENIISKEKICEIEENESYGINVYFKTDKEKESTMNILTYWSNIMKINRILNKRSNENDFIIGFVTGTISNN